MGETQKGENAAHCWHRGGYAVSNMAGTSWEERCCWCGQKRSAHQSEQAIDGHGPHVYVTTSVTTYQGSDGPCPMVPSGSKETKR